MSKKEEDKKSLQKGAANIVSIYLNISKKKVRKEVHDFIEMKVAEIFAFKDKLQAERKMAKKLQAKEIADATQTSELPKIQPSVELISELLHNDDKITLANDTAPVS